MSLARLDDRSLRIGRGEIALVACVRNESLRLPAFLDHHRKLGIDRFILIDNDSDDGTTELLLAQPGVNVFGTRGSYAAAQSGKAWINTIVETYLSERWALTVDADELFIYPEYESLPVQRLTGFLHGEGARAMAAIMIDMYGQGRIAETHYEPGHPFLDSCPYFDRDTYFTPHAEFFGLNVHGGPRARVFRYTGGRRSPFLGKVPLVFWHAGVRYPGSTHWLEGVPRSGVTGGLLHFKFFSDFGPRVKEEVARKEHWSGATEYLSYAEALEQDPDISFYGPHSERFVGSRQLVGLGLLRTTPEFDADASSRQ